MPETKYVVDALPHLSQDTTIDLANRSDVGKWSIEHYTAVVLSDAWPTFTPISLRSRPYLIRRPRQSWTIRLSGTAMPTCVTDAGVRLASECRRSLFRIASISVEGLFWLR